MKPVLAILALATLSAAPLAARASDYVIIDRYPVPTPQIWVEPDYRIVQERVYIPAEYRTVWVQIDGRLVQGRELIHEGYYTYVERRVCVTPGHWVYPPYQYPVYPVDPPRVIYRDPAPQPVRSYDASEHGTFSPTYEWPK